MKALRKLAVFTAELFALVLGAVVLTLYLFQATLIYHPRPYPAIELEEAKDVVRLEYRTSQGDQTSFYLPPRSGAKPETVWFLFSGNGSLALDWIYFLQNFPDPNTGFVFVEYPGYGMCHGNPTPDSIDESADAAFHRASEAIGGFDSVRLNVLGNSLGGAPALKFALVRAKESRPVEKLALVAPFTTMSEMAGLTVGRPLAMLLRHRFDNTGSLKSILQSAKPPAISIFHGTNDEVIPFRMGEELSKIDSARIRFHPYQGEYHNTVLGAAQNDIFSFMTGKQSGSP